MKKRIFLLALLTFLVVSLTLPTLASDGSSYLFDTVGLLSEEQWDELNDLAAALSQRYECGIYAVIVDDYADYTYSGGIQDASEQIYTANSFGLGNERSGIVLLLSMDDRDYDLTAYGYGNTAFTDYGKTVLSDEFLDDFARDRWYEGLSDYINTAGELLRQSREGTPLDNSDYGTRSGNLWQRSPLMALVICLAIPCLIAFFVCSSMKRQMLSVAKASSAREYVAPGSLNLYDSADNFTHITESRIKVESDSDRSGGSGGGGTTVNSSGFSHSSGKF